MRLIRLVTRALERWKATLDERELKLLLDYSLGLINPDQTDPFPDLYVTLKMEDCGGFLSEVNSLTVEDSDISLGKKKCYKIN